MFEAMKKQMSKHSGFLVLALPAAIVLLYLWCVCISGAGAEIGKDGITADGIREFFENVPFYVGWAFVNSLVILLGYGAWRSYRNEEVPVSVPILLSGLAVILPFWCERSDLVEMLSGFVMILWPVPTVCLIGFGLRKMVRNEKVVFGISAAAVFLLAVRFHMFAGSIMKESWNSDLGVPAIWLLEILLWSAAVSFSGSDREKRRNLVLAWLACLVIFYFSTFMEASYLSSCHMWDEVRGRCWNRVLFLCWPVFLTALTKKLCSGVPKDRPYFSEKVGALYFLAVLPLCWLMTDISLNFAVQAFRDDICGLLYLLFLAEFVIWKEVYGEREQRENRVRALLILLLVNTGAAVYLLVRNERLREVLYYLGFPFREGSPAMRTEWREYRKATAGAFFTNDLAVLDSTYRNDGFYYILNGSHGLASIRFHAGMFPLLVMLLLLTVTVMLLLSRRRDGGDFSKCVGYLAVGWLVKMAMSVILQMNMVLSPCIEFPFTGTDMTELVVLALVLHEGRRRMCGERKCL